MTKDDARRTGISRRGNAPGRGETHDEEDEQGHQEWREDHAGPDQRVGAADPFEGPDHARPGQACEGCGHGGERSAREPQRAPGRQQRQGNQTTAPDRPGGIDADGSQGEREDNRASRDDRDCGELARHVGLHGPIFASQSRSSGIVDGPNSETHQSRGPHR